MTPHLRHNAALSVAQPRKQVLPGRRKIAAIWSAPCDGTKGKTTPSGKTGADETCGRQSLIRRKERRVAFRNDGQTTSERQREDSPPATSELIYDSRPWLGRAPRGGESSPENLERGVVESFSKRAMAERRRYQCSGVRSDHSPQRFTPECRGDLLCEGECRGPGAGPPAP